MKKKLLVILIAAAVSLGTKAETVKENEFSNGNYQSIFYVNDIHGQLGTMYRINNASTQFDAIMSNTDNVDYFKFSAGDIFIGSDENSSKATVTFLNATEIEATAIGNHEFDMGASKLSKVLKDVKAHKIAANAYIPSNNPLKKQIIKSIIITGATGERYGIIGAQSPTLIERMKDKSLFEGIKISGGTLAYKQLQEEVNKLEKQGIKRIVVLSHSGYEEEKCIAKNVTGIDIIIGGHSHDLIFDITEGVNLLYSPKGEPVIITQAGRDGKNFGILNIEYDKNGIVTKAQNNVYTTNKFNKGMLMTTAINVVLGQSPVLGKIEYVETLTDRMNVEENPYADVFLDIVKKETGADIVLMNSANFRGSLDKGDFTIRDINGIFPFKNSMCIVELSEKNLIEALNHGGSSLLAPDLKPSFIQVSGIKYTLSKEGKVIKASVIGKNGQITELNVKNPSDTKMFKAAYDDYLLNGGDNFISLKGSKIIKKYNYDKDEISIRYFQKNPNANSLVIKKDGRINIEK